MAMTALEAYDLVRFSEQFLERLGLAGAELEKRRGHKAEKEWLASATALVQSARELEPTLMERVRGLPDLEEIRGEFASQLQSQWAEAVERLLAGFTFHVGSKDPVVEALFPTQKLAPLHKAPREVVTAFVADFERRQKSGYVSRMLATPNFAFAAPVLEQIAQAWQRWQNALGGGEAMPEEQAAELRKELLAVGKRLDLAIRQARLLAEAALLGTPGVFEELGLNAKPRRRAGKGPASIDEIVARHAPAAKAEDKPAAAEKKEAAAAEKKKEPAPAPNAGASAAPAVDAAAPAEAPAPKRKKKAAAAPPAGETPA
ncbi:MAG: hypothetical protein ACK4N5_11890 [Myxococcales bacterium]